MSAPSLHAYARLKQTQLLPLAPVRQDLELYMDKVMAPQSQNPLGPWPGSSDNNSNTRRRLDTFSNPDDENARSAVLLHFPWEQIHAGVSTWFEKFWATTNAPACNKPSSVIAERIQSLYEADSPFCHSSTKILVCRSKSLEDREIGRRFAPLWAVLVLKLQEIFLERGGKGTFIVPALDVRARILIIFDRSNGVWVTGVQTCTTWTRPVD